MNATNQGRTIKIAGIVLLITFIPLPFLSSLRGENLVVFLLCYSLAGTAYVFALIRLELTSISLRFVWVVAIIVRLILLATTPTLSDDSYRYMWDGHLLSQGINPYAEVVNSPSLNQFDTSFRPLVNHPWMSTPYLPAAQGFFWLVEQITPQKVITYQVAAVIFDLLTGLLVQFLLARLRLQRKAVLIYLWNPLVIFEFAQGAHIDAMMMFLTMLAWVFVLSSGKKKLLSPIILSLATLTKGLPVFIAPLLLRRWKIPGVLIYLIVTYAAMSAFAFGSGWGLTGELDGRGIFGAIRIYSQYWQFNAGPIYKVVELFPKEKEMIGQVIRLISGVFTMIVIAWSAYKAWGNDQPGRDSVKTGRALIRLSILPIGAFLLLSPTIHPWYVTMLIPFIPFFFTAQDEGPGASVWIIPLIYFSIAVAFSYMAYRPGQNSVVPSWFTWLEYLTLYGLLLWAGVRTRARGSTLHE